MPPKIERFGIAQIQGRWPNAILFEEAFQILLANAREIILLIEFQHRFGHLDKVVVETGVAEIALLCGANDSVPSLRGKQPIGPAGRSFTASVAFGVPRRSGLYGVEPITLFPRNLNEDLSCDIGWYHFGLQVRLKTMAGERDLGRYPPRPVQLLGLEAHFKPHPIMAPGSNR